MYSLNIFLIIGFFYHTEGLDIKIPYCRFTCSNSCEDKMDKLNFNGDAKAPTGYYFRDFYGAIPPDAYPLGPPTQFPQTYIGLAYDPDNNGSYATTIYDGLDYVYNAVNNDTKKISEHIQILCTESPGSLSWFKLTSENYKTVTSQGYRVVKAAFHQGFINNNKKYLTHYIVKTNKCRITYAGVVSSLTAELEYALIDGTYASSDDYLWLMYKSNDPSKSSEAATSESSTGFFSHHYEYQIRPDSIIPKFYKKLTIGSCSITCTNEDKAKSNKIKGDVKLSSSMAYFWQPIGAIDKNEALPAGSDYNSKIQYIGQAPLYGLNLYDTGPSNLKSALIPYGGAMIEETSYFHVFSSNYPDKFKWVNTTSDDFLKLDENKLIPGGASSNGTVSYVCRIIDERNSYQYIGAGRVLPTGTLCFYYYGGESEFQILMYKQEKK